MTPVSIASALRAGLRREPLFDNVDLGALDGHPGALTDVRVRAGDMIFADGDEGDAVYLLRSGKVEIIKGLTSGKEVRLGVVPAGGVLGELDAIDNRRRSAGARALVRCRLLAIDKRAFRTLLRESPALAGNLLAVLGGRLRQSNLGYVSREEDLALDAGRQIKRLEALIDAARLMNSSLNLRTLLTIILDTAVQMVNAARGTLYLVDEARGEIRSHVVSGTRAAEIRLAIGEGIAGHVARAGVIVNISDAYRDPRFNPSVDKVSGYVTRSMLCMPLRNRKNAVIGVFQLLNRKGGPFDAGDEFFIEALSGHAANAIGNARQAEQMVREGRLSVVGRMAASIVHDIRNPLNMLRLSTEMIGRKTDDPDILKILGMMDDQIDRFGSMAEEIIDFSRGTALLDIGPVDVTELVDEVAGIFAGKIARREIRLRRRIGYDGSFEGDFNKLLRVLQNLVGNALDAMPKGGTLGIGVTRDGPVVRFEVSDDGPGIPEEIRGRIFEPFQTHGKKHGTGLGLAIVKKIAEDHRGSVRAESGAGKGTRMIVTLPLKQKKR